MFDIDAFAKSKFTPRTEKVKVPDLAGFFPEGEAPEWEVRGLTGQELGKAKELAASNKNLAAIMAALVSDSSKELAEGVKSLVKGADVPTNIAERISYMTQGSVAPECSEDQALLFCERYPVEFYNITTKILQLTGQGQVPGKLPASSPIPLSEQP